MRPYPPTMKPSALQLQAAIRVIVGVLNSDDNDGIGVQVLQEFERQTGLTVRTPQQETVLRNLVQLADVKADQGLAEEVSLEDADMWLNSKFIELREEARVSLRRDEICEFLARGYESCAQGECRAVQVQNNNKQGWPAGHAVVFTWVGDGPHPAIDQMLDVMDIDSERTTFEGQDAIVGFLGDRCSVTTNPRIRPCHHCRRALFCPLAGPSNPSSMPPFPFLTRITMWWQAIVTDRLSQAYTPWGGRAAWPIENYIFHISNASKAWNMQHGSIAQCSSGGLGGCMIISSLGGFVSGSLNFVLTSYVTYGLN